jgi:hypothetical protein
MQIDWPQVYKVLLAINRLIDRRQPPHEPPPEHYTAWVDGRRIRTSSKESSLSRGNWNILLTLARLPHVAISLNEAQVDPSPLQQVCTRHTPPGPQSLFFEHWEPHRIRVSQTPVPSTVKSQKQLSLHFWTLPHVVGLEQDSKGRKR